MPDKWGEEIHTDKTIAILLGDGKLFLSETKKKKKICNPMSPIHIVMINVLKGFPFYYR